MNLSDTRAAIAEALVSTGLAIQPVGSIPRPPCLMIYPDRLTYHDTFDGQNPQWIVQCWLPGAALESGLDQLDGWLSTDTPGSLITVLEDDTNYVGVVSSVTVIEARNYGIVQIGESQFPSAELVLDILT